MKIDESTELSILVVDDTEMDRFLMVYGMESINPYAKIDQAATVDDAIDQLSNWQYDVVLSDWCMPERDGRELVRWMRSRPEFDNVPFIMVSGQTSDHDVEIAMSSLGVDGYIAKPFTQADLLRTITDTVAKKR